ncbi:MAG TPA: hypothetical protein PK867_18290 [Pirellulales bacterium]|nr:hypothetical protein [Pirellulales bacterium]
MIKFVILSFPRTGSNLLAAALRDHPAVKIFGELMNRNSSEAVGELAATWPDCRYRHGGQAGEMLAEWLFNPARHAAHVRAAGFKLFYDQAREDGAAFSVWTALLDDPTVHVLHVIRQNLLQVLVSLRTALATDVWAVVREPDGGYTAYGNQGPRQHRVAQPPVRLRIVPEEAEGFFKSVIAEREWVRRAFQDHPYLAVHYVPLTQEFPDTTTNVFRFLRLPDHRVSPGLVRQSRATPREQIENYEELRTYFRRTIFAEYFVW